MSGTTDEKDSSSAMKFERLPNGDLEMWLSNLEANCDGDNCDDFVDLMVGYSDATLGFAGFLAGFEFIGLTDLDASNDITLTASFIITLSFTFAIIAGVGSLIQLQYFRFHKGYKKHVVKKAIIDKQ